MYKQLILTHHKHQLIGDFLIDDRLKNGAAEFKGAHIHIFTEKYPTWQSCFGPVDTVVFCQFFTWVKLWKF
ncbi:hypothetical protein GCM10022216_18180 [Sphingobacterium kyonggiense]|uniref:Uncharacterized protein n=2 Tax=Sphingobacterium kyonggiense TaxID=714075 RepID=A0ABP7YQR5_9SPHI